MTETAALVSSFLLRSRIGGIISGTLLGNLMPIFESRIIFSYPAISSNFFTTGTSSGSELELLVLCRLVALRDPCDLLALPGVVGVGGSGEPNGERGVDGTSGSETGVFLLPDEGGVRCLDLLERGQGDSRETVVPALSGDADRDAVFPPF